MILINNHIPKNKKSKKTTNTSRRRKSGEGTIYWDEKSGNYIGQITIGRRENGTQIRKSVYGKESKEVVDKLNKIKRDLLIGEFVNADKTTVIDWIQSWLDIYKKIEIKMRTYDSYFYLTNQYIKPSIGYLYLQELENRHIQIMYNKLFTESDITANTIKKIHNIIKPSLKQAITNGLIPKNPAESVNLPKIIKKDIKVFTTDEQITFENKAKQYRLYEAFIFCLDTGLRTCEILALTYDDIDLKNKLVKINKNLVEVRDYKNNCTTLKIQPSPKTHASRREIPLSDRVCQMVRYLKYQRGELSNIIFCNKEGNYMRPSSFSHSFRKVLVKAKISNCGPHSMRHTFATRLFEINVPAKTISKLLGHTSVAFTLDTYAHVLPDKKFEAIKMLQDKFINVQSTENTSDDDNDD